MLVSLRGLTAHGHADDVGGAPAQGVHQPQRVAGHRVSAVLLRRRRLVAVAHAPAQSSSSIGSRSTARARWLHSILRLYEHAVAGCDVCSPFLLCWTHLKSVPIGFTCKGLSGVRYGCRDVRSHLAE